jgi:hypothetical protein
MMTNILKSILRICACVTILVGSIWTFNFGLSEGSNPGGYAYVLSCLVGFDTPNDAQTAAIFQEQFMLGVILFAGSVLILQLLPRREAALSVGEKIAIPSPARPRHWVRRPGKKAGVQINVRSRRGRPLLL